MNTPSGFASSSAPVLLRLTEIRRPPVLRAPSGFWPIGPGGAKRHWSLLRAGAPPRDGATRAMTDGANRHRLPGQEVRHTLRANGTLLTGQWYELLAEHGFLVGISIGGPPALRDRYRVDKRGNPTFDKVVQGLRLLKKPNVEFDIQCTVNAADPDRPLAVYRYFRDELGARRLRFIPSSSGTTTPGSG